MIHDCAVCRPEITFPIQGKKEKKKEKNVFLQDIHFLNTKHSLNTKYGGRNVQYMILFVEQLYNNPCKSCLTFYILYFPAN